MGAERVFLWRHGRTGHNAEGRFQGQLDIPLDDVGLDQAKRAAEALAGRLRGQRVRLVSSDLSRASSTAEQLGLLLGVQVDFDVRLREVYAGAWQGLLRADIEAGWPTEYVAWRAGSTDVHLGGDGESHREAAVRAASAIMQYYNEMDGGTLVLASHGAALRGAILTLIGATDFPWNALEGLRNCHWAELSHGRRGWRLNSYNVSC